MSENSPRTFQTEAVVGQGGGWGGDGERREAARCSCAVDRDDVRGRPCAPLRQAPAVLRVRAGCASAPVRLQRVGLSSCDAETGGGGERGWWQAALSACRPGVGAHHTGGEPM